MRSIALLAVIMAAVLVQPSAAIAADPADPATLDRGAHPGSIGFADPDDLSALLGYLLPDWGWRAWVIDGSFYGRGHSPTTLGTPGNPRLDYRADLQTEATWYRESEPRAWELNARLSGDWARQRDPDLWNLFLDGRYRVTAQANQYLLDDRWFVGVRAMASGAYRERRVEQPDGAPEDVVVDRLHGHDASLRLGWGRIRDVTPLVRAQRLAERLVALGRPRPTDAQVQAAARVLAQENGYLRVYDRPDRRLWDRILAPLVGSEPLSVAEVFYLRDAMREDLGRRRQGTEIAALASWRQVGANDDLSGVSSVGLEANSWRHLSLALQLVGRASASWDWQNASVDWADGEVFRARGSLGVLWNVADRLRLDADLWGDLHDIEREGWDSSQTTRRAGTSVAASVYLEDRLTLRPYAELSWEEREMENSQDNLLAWSYGFTFSYVLDGLVF